MDALELLKEDHQKVKALFEELEGAENKEKTRIFSEIQSELETHTRIEESIFYPAMDKHDELKDMVLEAIEEHKQVKTLLREIDKLKANSDKLDPKLKVLMENVEHHAEEEEEGKMFPRVRQMCTQEDLEKLGQELAAAKSQTQRKAS